jgi:hypothetical protein
MKTPRIARPRRGFGLALAMLALLVLAMVAASLLRRSAGARRVLVADERALQADWLAESGLDRAAARLADDPSFAGETWTIPASDLGGPDGAAVAITVEPAPGRPGARLVRVRADYPDDPTRRARASKSAEIPVPATEEERR